MSTSSYQKNGKPENAIWVASMAEFKGFTRAKLENIQESLNSIKEDIQEVVKLTEKNKDYFEKLHAENKKQIDINRNDIINNKIDTVKITIVVTGLVTFLSWIAPTVISVLGR